MRASDVYEGGRRGEKGREGERSCEEVQNHRPPSRLVRRGEEAAARWIAGEQPADIDRLLRQREARCAHKGQDHSRVCVHERLASVRLQNVQHPGHNRLVHGEVEPLTLGVDSQRAVGGLPLGELACKDQLHEACARVARPNELEEDAGDQQLRA